MRLIYKILLYVAIGILALLALSANPKSISLQPAVVFASEGFVVWEPPGYVDTSVSHGIFLAVVDIEVEKVVEKKTININYVKKTYIPKTIEKNEAYNLIVKYSEIYGFDTNLALNIAYCESGFRSDAVSPTGCAGIYQFSKGTFSSTANKMGRSMTLEDRFDAEKNIEAAIWKLSHEGDGAWRTMERTMLPEKSPEFVSLWYNINRQINSWSRI